MLTPANFVWTRIATERLGAVAALLVATLALAGCAALQPPSATGPTGNIAPYPILLTEDSHRKEAIGLALQRLALQPGNVAASEAQLQPVTGTILNFSPGPNRTLYLPKLGASAVMNEEETRESLRRFIKEWQELIGADPAKLSLVERTDQPDGTKTANYEQRAFRYPLRGNYGKLQIRFGADRRLLNVASTCIPDAERIQGALGALAVRVKVEDAIQQLRQRGLSYLDNAGTQRNFSLAPGADINPVGLVTYVLPAKDRLDALEIHLAWEVALTNSPVSYAYLDAISGDLLAAR
jgi:hypothetical protein